MNPCINNEMDGEQKNLAINWDIIINFTVIGSIILIAISKLTGQTIGELFKSIREFVLDTRENVQDKAEDLVYYEWWYIRSTGTRYS